MKVLKFGGTSVGSPDRIKKLLDIINPKDRQIVVLSAVSGTTNSLLEISQAYLGTEKQKATELIKALKDKYEIFIKELFASAVGPTIATARTGLEPAEPLLDALFPVHGQHQCLRSALLQHRSLGQLQTLGLCVSLGVHLASRHLRLAPLTQRR